MPTYRAQVVFPFVSNLPQDVMTNTFHFDPLTPLGFEETADLVQPHLIDFYEAVYDQTSYQRPNYLHASNQHVNWYDLSAPAPRVPYTLPLPLPGSTTSSVIPTEVACVLSISAPQVSGQPQARRRGRIFLGALGTTWMSASTVTQFPRFSAARLTSLQVAAEALRAGVEAAGVHWTIWSPTDAASAIVTHGWIDDSPDTQRRRGVETTARTLWPA